MIGLDVFGGGGGVQVSLVTMLLTGLGLFWMWTGVRRKTRKGWTGGCRYSGGLVRCAASS